MDHQVPGLTAQELSFFRAHNYVALDGCLSKDLAERWTRDALARRNISLEDRSTWPHDVYRLPDNFAGVELRDLAPRAWQAATQLVGGAERLVEPMVITDSLVLNTDLGGGTTWASPETMPHGWHVDGDYNHFLDSPESGLMMIILFTDVHERGGATWIAADSIAPVARALRDHPEGLSAYRLRTDIEIYPHCREFAPLVGPAGRIYLMHPFMLHTSSWNEMKCLRAIRNAGFKLRAPMQLDPARYVLNEVEQATVRALGGPAAFSFTAPSAALRHPTHHDTGERMPVVPEKSLEERRRLITVNAAALARMATPVLA